MILQIGVVILLIGILIKVYVKKSTGWCKSHTCLVGKTIIITGANQGIGYETALNLAERGGRVILACRNEEKAQEARRRIIDKTGNTDVVVRIIDMASFESVRNFSKNILATEERIDILINNAGILDVTGNQKTIDGHLQITQVNYFSSFLLTYLLLDLIKKTGHGRIVNVSSSVAMFAYNLTPNKLVSTQSASLNIYFETKLCNILFTQELARRLVGTNVTTYSLDPGIVDTQIFKYTPKILDPLVNYLKMQFMKTREEGAQTSIYCAVQKGIEKHSGEHFCECKNVTAYGTARDVKLAREICEKTEEILGL